MNATAGAGGDDDRGGSGRKRKDEGHLDPGKQGIGRNSRIKVQETRDGETKESIEELTHSDGKESALPELNMGGFGFVEINVQKRRGRFLITREYRVPVQWAGDDLEAMDKAIDMLRNEFSRMELEKEMSMDRSAATTNPSPGSSKNIHSGTSAPHTGTSAPHTGTSASGGTDNTSEPSSTGNKDESNDSKEDDNRKEV